MLLHRLFDRAVFAPENDQGAADQDDDLDLDLDLDPDADPDDLDPDADPDDQEDDENPDDQDGEGDPAPAPAASRGENRVAAATRIAKEAKDRADALEREMADLRKQALNPPQPRETQAQFEARLAQMEPWERTEELRRVDAIQTQARLAKMEFDTWERGDQVAYESLASREPIAAKLRDEVEKTILAERAKGRNVDRTTVLKFLIGERALAGKNRATGRATKAAAVNRERQAAKPGNGRADVPTGDSRRGSDSAARARRLENMEI